MGPAKQGYRPGRLKAAAKWSRNVVTPRDKVHVVESLDDLQIELLATQVVDTVRPI